MQSRKRTAIAIVAALHREIAKVPAGPPVCITGIGVRNVAARLVPFLKEHRPSAILGMGFAGALSESLQPGDLLVARESDTLLLQAALRLPIERLTAGRIVTVDRVVCTCEEKRELASAAAAATTGGCPETACVDMESSAILDICTSAGTPCLLLRSITDTLDETLPVDFNRFRSPGGDVRVLPLIASVLTRPGCWMGMRRLQQRSRLCAERMGHFAAPLIAALVEKRDPLEVR